MSSWFYSSIVGKSHIRCSYFLKCKINGFVTTTASRGKNISLVGEKKFPRGSGKKLFQEITETIVSITPGCCRVRRLLYIIYCQSAYPIAIAVLHDWAGNAVRNSGSPSIVQTLFGFFGIPLAFSHTSEISETSLAYY